MLNARSLNLNHRVTLVYTGRSSCGKLANLKARQDFFDHCRSSGDNQRIDLRNPAGAWDWRPSALLPRREELDHPGPFLGLGGGRIRLPRHLDPLCRALGTCLEAIELTLGDGWHVSALLGAPDDNRLRPRVDPPHRRSIIRPVE